MSEIKQESFAGKVEIFPDGWYFVKVPVKKSQPYLTQVKRGNIPIQAQVGSQIWPTLLWGFGDATFFVTLPAKVRRHEKIEVGDEIEIKFKLR